MKNNKLISIVVIVCIIAAIAGIAVFKNMQDGSDAGATKGDNTAGTVQDSGTQSTSSDPGNVDAGNDDFALEVESIDLNELRSFGLPIIIDFGADECAPCREMAPVLRDINTEMQGKALIKFIDVWQHPDGVAEFPIQLIPTQVIFDAAGNPYFPSADIDIELTFYRDKITDEHVFTTHQGGLTAEQMRTILADMGVT